MLMQNINTKWDTPPVCLYHPAPRALPTSLTLTVAHFLAKLRPQGRDQSCKNKKNTILLSLFSLCSTFYILKIYIISRTKASKKEEELQICGKDTCRHKGSGI